MISTTHLLHYQPPFNWERMLGFFRHRAIPGVERVTEQEYIRSIRINDASGWIHLTHCRDHSALSLDIHIDQPEQEKEIITRIRRIMDLDAPMAEIEHHLSQTPLFAELISRHRGTRLPGCWDPFEFSVRAILGQQISVKAATTLAGRIARAYGKPLTLSAPEDISHYFPDASVLANMDFENIGLTRTRKATLQNLAKQVASGALKLEVTDGLADFVKRLVKEPGIGPWTAHYLAMRGFSQADAFPASDLGIIKRLSSDETPLKPRQIETMAEDWQPWRAYAATYLWQG